jgi:DNA invertase Pin-like site-specific DNA recombinase
MTSNDIAGKWLRVSTGDQDERDQEPDIERWIEDHEYATGPTYRLHGASASKGKQDKMIARVLEDMRAGRITVLVVWYSARIERRGAWDHMNLAHKAKLAGGRIEYVKEPQLNEVNAFSNTFLAMHADLNKKYSDDLSMNVRKSFDAIDANGGIRGRAIFGYRVVGDKKHKTFEIVEQEASVIHDATGWYLADESLAMICRKLNGAGRLTRIGSQWTPKSLSQVFRSETIMGRHHQGTKIVSVPPILTVREWRALQAKLDSKATRKGTRTRPDTAFLTSLLYCEHGHPLYRTNSYTEPVYYERYGCRPGLSLPLGRADQEVIDSLETPRPDLHFNREITIPGHNYQDDIDRIALNIQALDPTATDWLATVTAMHAEIGRLADLPAEPDRVEVQEFGHDEFIAEWRKMTMAERRELLITYGLRVYASRVGDTVTMRLTKMAATSETPSNLQEISALRPGPVQPDGPGFSLLKMPVNRYLVRMHPPRAARPPTAFVGPSGGGFEVHAARESTHNFLSTRVD